MILHSPCVDAKRAFKKVSLSYTFELLLSYGKIDMRVIGRFW